MNLDLFYDPGALGLALFVQEDIGLTQPNEQWERTMETSASLNDSIASLKLSRGWLLALGAALIVLGTVALGDTLAVTVVSVFLIGCLLIASGIFHAVHLVRHSEIRSFWNILGTVCDVGAGLYMIASPTLGALTLTLVLAVFLLVSGVTRLIAVYRANLPHKFWPFLDSILSIGLGDSAVGALAMDWTMVHRLRDCDPADFPRLDLGDDSVGARRRCPSIFQFSCLGIRLSAAIIYGNSSPYIRSPESTTPRISDDARGGHTDSAIHPHSGHQQRCFARSRYSRAGLGQFALARVLS